MFEWLKNMFSHEKNEVERDAEKKRTEEHQIRENKTEDPPHPSPSDKQHK